MSEVGKKYVIEIAEKYGTIDYADREEADNSPEYLYRVKEFNSLVFDANGLKKLKPYKEWGENITEQELLDEAYKHGLDEAWEIVRRIMIDDYNDKFPYDVVYKLFHCRFRSNIFKEYTASEAIEKIRAYEEEQGKIKIGDEVEYERWSENERFIVTNFSEEYLMGINPKGEARSCHERHCTKTGRHFPQISEVLRQMERTEVCDADSD